jgi:hypothetical protein
MLGAILVTNVPPVHSLRMRNGRRISFAALILAIIGIVAWKALRPREPIYEGKPLSFWLQQQHDGKYGILSEEKEKSREEAEAAIRQIGTNALPQLMRLLRARDPWITRKVDELIWRQRIFDIEIPGAVAENGMALDGLKALREAVSKEVPTVLVQRECHFCGGELSD